MTPMEVAFSTPSRERLAAEVAHDPTGAERVEQILLLAADYTLMDPEHNQGSGCGNHACAAVLGLEHDSVELEFSSEFNLSSFAFNVAFMEAEERLGVELDPKDTETGHTVLLEAAAIVRDLRNAGDQTN